MNDPRNHAHLSIPNEYETVVQYVAQNMRDRCLGLYRKALKKLSESIPMPWNEFTAIHQTIFETIVKEYVGGLVGTLKQIEGFKEKFQYELEEAKKPYHDRNSKELYAFNIGQAKILWNQLIEPGLKIDQLFTEDEFHEPLKNFEQQLRQIWIESPEAMEALKYYKENYYKSAINTLTKLERVNDKLVAEMKEQEKFHKQYLEFTKKEIELNNKLGERNQQMQIIKETLEAKSQAIQQAMEKQRAMEKQHLAEVKMERLKAENQRIINDMRAKHAADMARLQRDLQAAQIRGGGACAIQ